jgi:hypothetical protein
MVGLFIDSGEVFDPVDGVAVDVVAAIPADTREADLRIVRLPVG